ncbi:MAG: DNA gyrase C-terminal beta-propeller domain-containing protein [Anaerolineae bacterium]
MTRDGIVIRTEVKGIKQAGRPTRGSRAINLKKGDFVASVTNLTPRTAHDASDEGEDAPKETKETPSKGSAAPAKPKAPSAPKAAGPDADSVLAKPSAIEQTRSIKDPKAAKKAEDDALATLRDDPGAPSKPTSASGKGVNSVKLGGDKSDGKNGKDGGTPPRPKK